MNQKDMKGLIGALEKVAEENKEVTGLLLEKLEIISKSLTNLIEENHLSDNLEMFDCKGFGFKTESDYPFNIYITYDYKILPNLTKDIDGHGDENDFMDRNTILNFCNILPEFIQNMKNKIQSNLDREGKIISELDRLFIKNKTSIDLLFKDDEII